MSATNWGYCYECEAADKRRLDELTETAMKPDSPEWNEYHKLKKKLESYSDYETLREDYEIGIFKVGEFWVDYSCFCENCGTSHNFKHTEKVKND